VAEISKLGRYELRRMLGRGAMGVVYEGFDPNLSRRVAVKTILKSIALDPEIERAYAARFIQEAKAVARLNHPNIVQVYDFGVEGEVAYLVMEFIEGRELRNFFEANEKFALEEVVRIMCELLDALEFAHKAGVIHRDVKPANVMLDAQRRAKLADFGVARVQESEHSTMGTMVGTPAFMSPEQIKGGKIDRRTDIFSAGVVLYQLLTGEQPFKGEGAWTVSRRIVEDEPPPPSSVVHTVSPVFDSVVNKALAKMQTQRYASAGEFAGALRAALANPQQPPPVVMPKPKIKVESRASEAEVEFWRSIQNSNDPAEFETYLQEFPQGTYAQLARVKMAKLLEPIEAARKEAEEKSRQEAEAKEKAHRESEARAKADAEARARREAEEVAKRQAAERAKQESEERTRREAEEKARREAIEIAKREAAENARREAEERLRREAEGKALREAAAKAKLEAEANAKRAAAEKKKRETEENARHAQALAKLKQQEEAAARAKVSADADATVAIEVGMPKAASAEPTAAKKKSPAVPAIAIAVVVVTGIAVYLLFGRTPAGVPVVEAPPSSKDPATPAAPAVDVEKIRRDTEERLRKEFAEKLAVEKAAMGKALADKVAAEKVATEKLALAKTAAEKDSAGKAAQKAAAERVAAEKLATERVAAGKLAAENAAVERANAEKAAAEKLAGEKAATEKAIAEKIAMEKAAGEKAAVAKSVEKKSLAISGYSGTWFGESKIWRLNLKIDGARVEGTMSCHFSNGNWSRNPGPIAGTINSDGVVDASIKGTPEGWTFRYVVGKLPELRIVRARGVGAADCSDGTVNLTKIDLNQPFGVPK
jgi:serine/threonine protein kinase